MASLLMGSKRLLVRDDVEGTEGVSYSKDRDVPKKLLFSELDLTILYKSTLEWSSTVQ